MHTTETTSKIAPTNQNPHPHSDPHSNSGPNTAPKPRPDSDLRLGSDSYSDPCSPSNPDSYSDPCSPSNPCSGLDALAAHLAQVPPTAGALDELEFEKLSAGGQLDGLVAWERQVRHANAGLIRWLGAMAQDTSAERWLIETEVCAALAWSPATAQGRLDDADALTRLFPGTLHLLADGQISAEQARCLPQLTFGLDDQAAEAVEARVLPRMPGQSVSVTRQAVRRAVLRADPAAAEKRHQHQRTRRRVELIPEDDGMATLNFYLPADVAQMAMRTLTALAQQAKRKNPADKRTLDQHRADLLPAALTRTTCTNCATRTDHAPGTGTNHSTGTGYATGSGIDHATSTDYATRSTSASTTPTAPAASTTPSVPAHITVVTGIETLLGLSHEPGHLTGHGPITAEHTRAIAASHASRWRFLLTATDGTPVTASRTYTPTAAIKYLTQLKHTTCAFPHCRMPADRCDLDHNQPFDKGGPTSTDNLAPLCRRHHNAKTHRHWNLTRTDDTITWTSNHTGRTYTTTPTRYEPVPVAA